MLHEGVWRGLPAMSPEEAFAEPSPGSAAHVDPDQSQEDTVHVPQSPLDAQQRVVLTRNNDCCAAATHGR